ncbi:hypothetical protein A3I42_00980 [Candidatus Uhrbacteria bacterium RIFCSPLOWO2_02_FULL_49_11]|uniref:Uncharacterized protein n=1 Tax=Candidatus Uhrbacteria bacterium RIFCSPLOWO2_02_FULL_49_11 TaxID=1802409 RepID=A0A1F7VB58_9BACT|nr:MAG: hypothetical protein A3I42_00980 [Candidatus Uhrbacteria bacterium RIFCSPLOWO2_02_FULL_49_11]
MNPHCQKGGSFGAFGPHGQEDSHTDYIGQKAAEKVYFGHIGIEPSLRIMLVQLMNGRLFLFSSVHPEGGVVR